MHALFLLVLLLSSVPGMEREMAAPDPERTRREVFDTLFTEGVRAYAEGDYSLCADSLRGATGVQPNAVAYRVLGQCLMQMDLWEEAIVAEERAVFYDPGDARSLTALAMAYLVAGMLLQADYRVEQAIAADPEAIFPRFLRVVLWDTVADSPRLPRDERRQIKERLVEIGQELLDESPEGKDEEREAVREMQSDVRRRVDQRKGELEREGVEP